jgi:hypothetical protein
MPGLRPRMALSILLALAILTAPRPSRAQCNDVQFGPVAVSLASSNPFQAVLTTTRTPPPRSQGQLLPEPGIQEPENIARDSQGRVRFDHVAGKFHMDSGPEAGADVETHIVIICDPVQGKLIQLNTANRTAIYRRLVMFRNPRTGAQPIGFCRVPPSSPGSPMTAEELGHRSIEGYDAVGWRETIQFTMPDATPPATMQLIRDVWCSEDLGAVLVSIRRGKEDGSMTEADMSQIVRSEPDPSLFQIPPDYTVSEAIHPQLRNLDSQPALGAGSQPPAVMH